MDPRTEKPRAVPTRLRPVDLLFHPRSLAIVGASAREGSAGQAGLRNLLRAGFPGPIGLVNPRYRQVAGRPCVPTLADLDFHPDLVVIAAPPRYVAAAAHAAAARGAGGAIVVTPDADPRHPLRPVLREVVAQTGMRVLGPNCLGLISPADKLDLSLAAQPVARGDIALVSQSSAVAAALAAWARGRGVGFSGLVSAGDMVDVDFADLLDHFATDEATRSILLFIESVGDVQSFMSAARAAARAKPVIALKAGFTGSRPRSMTHSGALADPDGVFDAACRRAGVLRVGDIDSLFDAAEALGRIRPFRGSRLAVVSNGPGIGDLSAGRLKALGGTLASLAEDTKAKIGAHLPPGVAIENPLDIGGDASPERLRGVLDAVVGAREVDAVMALHAPTALSRSEEAAATLAEVAAAARKTSFSPKPVFAVWYGATPLTDAVFEEARVPHYTRGAVAGFTHVVRWTEAREFLTSAPPSLPADFTPDAGAARAIVDAALQRRGGAQEMSHEPFRLSAEEAARLLAAYAIPVAPARFAECPEEAAELARLFIARAGACVVKIASPDIEDRSTTGGIALDLRSPDAVADAARAMLAHMRQTRPDARVEGVTVHPMVRRPHARELLGGLADDPTFGPVVVFGRGGKAVEVIRDRALALPPLDLALAHDLIRRTEVARLLEDYRDVPPADMDALALCLVKIAQIAADLPDVRAVDLNPLLADSNGVIAVDARVVVAPTPVRGLGANPRLAVAPYPKEQEDRFTLPDGTPVFVRPVRPEDEDTYGAFVRSVPPEDLRLRFFSPVRDVSHAFLARLTQVDYARAYAVAAFHGATGAMLGGVRLILDPDRVSGEYAILISPAMKGKGLGRALMERMIEAARRLGVERIEGFVLSENQPMLDLCRKLGFRLAHDPAERGVMRVTLAL